MLTGMIYWKKIRLMRMKKSPGSEGQMLIQIVLHPELRETGKNKRIHNLSSSYLKGPNSLQSQTMNQNYLCRHSQEKSTNMRKDKRKKRERDIDRLLKMGQPLNRKNRSNRVRKMTMMMTCKNTWCDRNKPYPSINNNLIVCFI